MAKLKRDYSRDKDGNRLPSVTEIIGKHLGWKGPGLQAYFYARGKAGEPMYAHRDAAGKKGSCVHDLIAAHYDPENHGDLSEWTDSEVAAAEPNAGRIYDAVVARGWQVLYVEEKIESESFAGTPDMVVRDKDGQVLIVDLKTSRSAYDETVIQVGAYAWLHRIRENRRFLTVSLADRFLTAALTDLSQPPMFATAGAVIHAPFGGPLEVRPISPAALVAGEQAFRLLLQLHEITPQIKLGEAA